MTSQSYVGRELDLFALAKNWKKYWSSLLIPHLRGDVLEAGAGVGTNTAYLESPLVTSWTCLEPDERLAHRMIEDFQRQPHLRDCRVEIGTIQAIRNGERFDTILYIDVLEHIDDDLGEMQRASRLLRPQGKLIVLSPAYQWLYAPFDRAIGHVRRYRKGTLGAHSPQNCQLLEMNYLDSVGMLASAGNRLFLSQSIPTVRQILFWDRYLVPVSRVIDRLTFHAFGKSILGIWTKT
ncbi:MAG: methyltransferase type 12 [Acidobacteria bacterium]|nr:MAG: methyltransferase type 12 [Acidobacteriota bacterium]